jgi:hypothetical protein
MDFEWVEPAAPDRSDDDIGDTLEVGAALDSEDDLCASVLVMELNS